MPDTSYRYRLLAAYHACEELASELAAECLKAAELYTVIKKPMVEERITAAELPQRPATKYLDTITMERVYSYPYAWYGMGSRHDLQEYIRC
jgi:hypothetical protein